MKIFQPIYGAVRLAQGKRDGMSLFGDSETDFWQSFYAAIIVAPLFFIFISLQSNTGDLDDADDTHRVREPRKKVKRSALPWLRTLAPCAEKCGNAL